MLQDLTILETLSIISKIICTDVILTHPPFHPFLLCSSALILPSRSKSSVAQLVQVNWTTAELKIHRWITLTWSLFTQSTKATINNGKSGYSTPKSVNSYLHFSNYTMHIVTPSLPHIRHTSIHVSLSF